MSVEKKPVVLILIGPTAVGKTDLSIELAQTLHCEIISADSRLFYRGMDIGTAKPTVEQQQMVPHHLIDIAEPDQVISLSIFQQMALQQIAEIGGRGKIPLIVGGTGQYIKAITEGWEIPPQEPDERLRSVIEKWGGEIGAASLHQRLAIIDPAAAQRIEYQNIRRTVRALEVIFLTGKRFSEQKQKKTPQFNFWMIGLNRPRVELYARIDERIEKMFAEGLVEETEKLLALGFDSANPNLSAIGYREVGEYLAGKTSLAEAKAMMKKKTREFVRRQANWFKLSDPSIHWYEMESNVKDQILRDLNESGMLHAR
jgi:tRNA dimethylallyltransferase